jgi:hypothetical protein
MGQISLPGRTTQHIRRSQRGSYKTPRCLSYRCHTAIYQSFLAVDECLQTWALRESRRMGRPKAEGSSRSLGICNDAFRCCSRRERLEFCMWERYGGIYMFVNFPQKIGRTQKTVGITSEGHFSTYLASLSPNPHLFCPKIEPIRCDPSIRKLVDFACPRLYLQTVHQVTNVHCRTQMMV